MTTKKRKNNQSEFVFPRGMRLTRNLREAIVKQAIKEAFSHKTEILFNKEIEFFNAIYEYIYTPQRKKAYENAVQAINKNVTVKQLYSIQSSISVKLADDRAIILGTYYNPYSMIKLRSYMLGDISYIMNKSDITNLSFLAITFELKAEDYYDILPSSFIKKLANFANECKNFKKNVKTMHDALETIVTNAKSLRLLCESFPEFYPWICTCINTLDNDTFNEPARCTDIPQHDLMQEVRKIQASAN